MAILTDKTILMVGVRQGYDVKIARVLMNAGAQVVFACHHTQQADAYSALNTESLQANVIPLDMDNPQTLTDAIPQAVDGAILLPAYHHPMDFMQTSPEDWDTAIQQNFVRMIYTSQAIFKRMIATEKTGCLLFLSSFAGMKPFIGTSITGTTLTALHAVAQMAAVDLGAYGIRVNVVACGWTDDEAARPYLHDAGHDFIQSGIPLGRIGTADEVGAACRFLLADDARYITGAVIPVDGGYTLTRADGDSPYPQKGA